MNLGEEDSQRDSLFSGSLRNRKASRHRQPDQSSSGSMEESKTKADSLLRTKTMMKQEMDRVSAVSQAIDRDGKLLRETHSDHKGMNSTVKDAKKTLGVLRRQDMEEAVVLWGSVAVFYFVALYVLWTRIRIPFLLW